MTALMTSDVMLSMIEEVQHNQITLHPPKKHEPGPKPVSSIDRSKVGSRFQSVLAVGIDAAGNKSACGPYVLMLALGLHSLFEGMALGLCKAYGELIAIFIAIIAHKFPECFGVAVAFASGGVEKKQSLILFIIFACISPVGVAIGLVMVSAGAADNATIAILIGVTSGMFLYVAGTEVIPEEFEKPIDKWLK